MAFEHQRYTDVGGEVVGDCWRTALAAVAGRARDEVPHFVAEYGSGWFEQSVSWVQEELPGRTLGCYQPEFPLFVDPAHEQLVVLTGPSPRGDFLHAVVANGRTGEMVHDPHPDGTGLAGDPVDVCVIVWTDNA